MSIGYSEGPSKELLKYTVKYRGGYPGFSLRGNGYFKVTEDEIEFLFLNLLIPRTTKLRFPLGSIKGIEIIQYDMLNRAGKPFGLPNPLIAIIRKKPPLKMMEITFLDNDGHKHTAVFKDILSELYVNGIQRAFNILVMVRKRYQASTGE